MYDTSEVGVELAMLDGVYTCVNVHAVHAAAACNPSAVENVPAKHLEGLATLDTQNEPDRPI